MTDNKSRLCVNDLLIYFFVISIFLTSDGRLFKIAGLSFTNISAILLIAVFILECMKYNMVLSLDNKIYVLIVMIMLWTLISTLLNVILNPAPYDSFSYIWAVGLNSPFYRGLSFFIRLMLSLFSIVYISSKINTKEKYFKVLSLFITCYGAFSIIPLVQAILFSVFHIELGQVFTGGITRFGAYVGEPSVLAGIIVSGYFVLVSTLINKEWCEQMWLSKRLRVIIFIISTLNFILTFSASIVLGLIIAFFISIRKYIRLKYKISIVALLGLIFTFSNNAKIFIVSKVISELTTINIRSLSWIIGARTFIDNWLIGVGIGRAPLFVGKYFPVDTKLPFDYRIYYNYTIMRHAPMNSYLEWLIENGLIGFILMMLLLITIIKSGKSYTGKSKLYKEVVFAFGTALLVYAVSMNTFPGGFYLPHVNFVLIMYISGISISKIEDKLEV